VLGCYSSKKVDGDMLYNLYGKLHNIISGLDISMICLPTVTLNQTPQTVIHT